MKRLPQILIRLVLLSILGFGAFYAYQYFNQSQSTSDILNQGLQKVKGVSTSLNIDPQSLLNQANDKLVKSQPIIEDISGTSLQNTEQDNLTNQTKTIIQDAANQALDQVKDLPKKQAAQVTRQVCEQILNQLESEQ